MFPDYLVIRIALRTIFGFLNSIAPLSITYTLISLATYPAPPLIILSPSYIPISFLIQHEIQFQYLLYYTSIETIFYLIHSFTRRLISVGKWDLKAEDRESITTEERWRIWIKFLESDEDTWSLFRGAFTKRGRKCTRGMEDDCLDVSCEEIGRTNVMQYIAHFYFDSPLEKLGPGSLERAELNCMVSVLELAITESRSRSLSASAKEDTIAFKFRHGKSQHHVFLLYDEPISSSHHPFLFYLFIYFSSEFCNFLLFLFGFRYYSSNTTSSLWPLPLFFMRSSRSNLDKTTLYKDYQTVKEKDLSDSVNYWFHPGSSKAHLEDLTPILFLHGISGTYGPTPFIILIQYLTGRAMFIPEFSYITMKLSFPSTILNKETTSLAIQRMLWRHGFALTEEEELEEDWRRGRIILLAHSLGSSLAAWILRMSPDIVAGCVLVDPMSIMLNCPSGPRNFFKTEVKTAAEIFFKFFARERGINHFLSRHLRSLDSVIFGSKPAVPLPPSALELIPKCAIEPLIPYDSPNYGPCVSPSPIGPFPSVLFYSEEDCILNVPKIKTYLEKTGFVKDSSLRIMPGQHAAVLISYFWTKQIAGAIDEVANAAEKLERERERD